MVLSSAFVGVIAVMAVAAVTTAVMAVIQAPNSLLVTNVISSVIWIFLNLFSMPIHCPVAGDEADSHAEIFLLRRQRAGMTRRGQVSIPDLDQIFFSRFSAAASDGQVSVAMAGDIPKHQPTTRKKPSARQKLAASAVRLALIGQLLLSVVPEGVENPNLFFQIVHVDMEPNQRVNDAASKRKNRPCCRQRSKNAVEIHVLGTLQFGNHQANQPAADRPD